MILLIDNYDSFTYNLYQYLAELGAEIEVVRNDKATVPELDAMQPSKVVVSPGPSHPRNAGISIDAIRHFAPKTPILGVCLGLQCMAEAFGGTVAHAGEIKHGKTSLIEHDGEGVFAGVDNPFEAIRYHSLAVQPNAVPPDFDVTARSTESKVIMGIRHKTLPVEGVQFHPESILTRPGKQLLANFLGFPSPDSN